MLRNSSLSRWAGATLVVVLLALPLRAGPMSGYVGHTSPHSREIPSENFSRPDKDGKIRPVSLIAQDKVAMPTLLSGTVYYMVFERDDRDPNDPWGTGIPNFMQTFRAGIDFNGGASPDLDTRAKYLYLYQVVNDQRTLPPIESMSTKLLVELSEITSWGHFHGLGFATREDDQVRPLSATHKIDQRTYLSPAPALPDTQPLSLAYVPTSQDELAPKREMGKIVQVQWDALDPATPPDYVMILGSSDFERHPSFRAIWTGKNAIGKDGRSTAFGFTSPMPPTIEPVRLRTSREATKLAGLGEDAADEKSKNDKPIAARNKASEAVKLAKVAEDEGAPSTPSGKVTVAGIEGRVPTPFPITAGLAFDPDRNKASGTPPPSMPLGGVPTGGGGGSGGGFGGGGLIPASSSSGSGGGAFPIPTSSGGGGFITVPVVTRTSTSSSASASVTVNNNFNISQSNQQSQSQFQFQRQGQSQGQHQGNAGGHGGGHAGGHGGGGNVVPEPASLISLAVGLPALLVAYRRSRRRPSPSEA